MTIKADNHILTAGRNGTRMWSCISGGRRISGPLFAVKRYVAKVRKTDGVLTWRLEDSWGLYSGRKRADETALAEACDEGVAYVHGVVHGDRCNPAPVELDEVQDIPIEDGSEDIHEWAYGEKVAV